MRTIKTVCGLMMDLLIKARPVDWEANEDPPAHRPAGTSPPAAVPVETEALKSSSRIPPGLCPGAPRRGILPRRGKGARGWTGALPVRLALHGGAEKPTLRRDALRSGPRIRPVPTMAPSPLS